MPSASKCQKINERNGIPRLSLKHLSSPLIILVSGYLISLVTIITERIVEKIGRLHQASHVVVI